MMQDGRLEMLNPHKRFFGGLRRHKLRGSKPALLISVQKNLSDSKEQLFKVAVGQSRLSLGAHTIEPNALS